MPLDILQSFGGNEVAAVEFLLEAGSDLCAGDVDFAGTDQGRG